MTDRTCVALYIHGLGVGCCAGWVWWASVAIDVPGWARPAGLIVGGVALLGVVVGLLAGWSEARG